VFVMFAFEPQPAARNIVYKPFIGYPNFGLILPVA